MSACHDADVTRILPRMFKAPAAVAAAACILTACGAHTTPGSTAVSPAAVDRPAAVVMYLRLVRPKFPNATDGNLLQVGRSVCAVFDGGASWLQVLKSATVGAGIDARRAGFQIGAAVETLCPRNTGYLPNVGR